jgi:hypothetical protein
MQKLTQGTKTSIKKYFPPALFVSPLLCGAGAKLEEGGFGSTSTSRIDGEAEGSSVGGTVGLGNGIGEFDKDGAAHDLTTTEPSSSGLP